MVLEVLVVEAEEEVQERENLLISAKVRGALTRAELKAKEIYDATKEPDVVRVHAPEDRVALGALTVGQKLRGRIISVKE